MTTKELNIKDARFDTRLSKDQKVFFERAARLGGFRNFTDFVVLAIQEKAKAIIAEKEQIISSEKDSEIFFEAVLNTQKPNKELVKAVKEFKSHFSN